MIRAVLKSEIGEAVKKLYGKEVFFGVSADGKHGDYSSNVAMVLGVGVPRETAEKIKNELEKSEKFSKLVSRVEIAGPGFLNFTLSEDGLMEGLKSCGERKKGGKKKIQVEFISANPTGQLHIGHARSAFFGDALSNTLEAAGHEVEREYFINDSKESTQIKELGKTVLGKGTSYLSDYLKSKISNLKSQNSILETQISNLKAEGREPETESEAGYLIAKEIQKDNQDFIAKKLGIKFDKWFSEEEELRKKKAFEKTLDLLKKNGVVYEKDGALWLKTSEFGDDEDRVLVRSDGSVSYFLSDIAYHINKFERGYDAIIDIWGADHQGHVKRMMAVKKMLAETAGIGEKCDFKILISQMVTLMDGGERKKLSKRKGTIVLLEDLVEEIGIDAARWFYLQKSLSTHMEFDLALAKERSRKNPVFYVQYAHARINSILEKAGASRKLVQKIAYPAAAHTYDFLNKFSLRVTKKGGAENAGFRGGADKETTSSPRAFIYNFLKDPTANPRVDEVASLSSAGGFWGRILRWIGAKQKSVPLRGDFIAKLLDRGEKPKLSPAITLIKKLIQFPEIIEDTADDYQVQRIATYAYELANEFSQFYRDVKVIGSENEKELIALVAFTGKTLKDALGLLGISAPEKM